jgi:hypothetical protein
MLKLCMIMRNHDVNLERNRGKSEWEKTIKIYIMSIRIWLDIYIS